MNKPAAFGVIGLLLLLGTAPLVAQLAVVQSPVGSAGLALVPTELGYRLESREGPLEVLQQPVATRLTAIAELADGWIAAGEQLVADGGALLLLHNDGSRTRRIIEPGGRSGFRRLPVPLVDKGRLSGLAWLEGDGGEKNSVAVARRTGETWQTVQTVSPLTGNAQLALSGAVLDDGSWLLVWAAIDGEDDEIMWSRFDSTAWSPPVRLHPNNAVPDVVPVVAAVADGALAAWSQFDGQDYRLKIAHFDGAMWSDTGFAGEEGSLFPTVFPTPTGAGFLYQTAAPRTWSLIEIAPDGRHARRTAMARGVEPRPAALSTDTDSVALRFADANGEAEGKEVGGEHRPIETLLDWVRER